MKAYKKKGKKGECEKAPQRRPLTQATAAAYRPVQNRPAGVREKTHSSDLESQTRRQHPRHPSSCGSMLLVLDDDGRVGVRWRHGQSL
ncbi:MAG TPA: hypothetical protein VG013_04820, partial [Gemmataceae bacterium]|nr:hypothetical protein [Gemmataceae bacterium]